MSRNNVLEKYIIDLCSPTLASLKTASLINCYFINEKQLEKDMAELNLLLNGKGIKIQTLRKSKKSVLIYVYRIDMLAKDLSAVDVGKFIATSVKLSVDLNFSINVQEFTWNSGKPARAF